MSDKKDNVISPCPKCGKTYGVTTRKDGSIRCRICGYEGDKSGKTTTD